MQKLTNIVVFWAFFCNKPEIYSFIVRLNSHFPNLSAAYHGWFLQEAFLDQLVPVVLRLAVAVAVAGVRDLDQDDVVTRERVGPGEGGSLEALSH